jgi:hypothetical protein
VPDPNRVKPMVGESRLEDGCLTLIGLNKWRGEEGICCLDLVELNL